MHERIDGEAIGRVVERLTPAGTLDVPRRLAILTGGITARGDDDLSVAFFPAAFRCGLDVDVAGEIVLQTHLFAGYPRTINAMIAVRAAGAPAPRGPVSGVRGDFLARGEALCRAVYGASYERLRENVRALHPDLDAWMVEEGYGRVLSREGVDPATRELAAISSLVVLDTPRQLASHLRGAMNVGAYAAEIDVTLEQLDGVSDGDALGRARDTWRSIRAR